MAHFTQLRYLPFSVVKPDLDNALAAITSDCGTDLRQMIDGYGSAKVWLTVQVRYEPANPKDEKNKAFEFFLSCAPTRFFRRDPTDGGDGAPYANPLRELCNRIKLLNAKFIRELSGLVLAGILQLVIRGVRYMPLAGRCFRELPKYLKNKKAIINIQNNDDRCFGYALLYFLSRPDVTNHFERSHFTRSKCSKTITSRTCRIRSLRMMFISMRIGSRLISTCSRSLMKRVKLVILSLSRGNNFPEPLISYTGTNTILRLRILTVYLMT